MLGCSASREVNNMANGGFGKVYDLEDLRKITDNFSEERLLGEGGFGKVYKGLLRNGDMIAVKKLTSTMPGIKDRQFDNEAQHLMRLSHPNIVQLVGYCSHTEEILVLHEGKYVYAEKLERLLCLEYLAKGSLHEHLSDESSGLDWDMRFKIIEGICNGLHYLHEKWQASTPIIHMDLKPKNILLDDNMMPKIADFGLSRLFGEEQTRTCTANRDGTLGYMAPEYLNRGIITTKLDIFSFGVIIIEIITGRKDYPDETETSSQEFIELVLRNWRNRMGKALRYTAAFSIFPSFCQKIDYQQIRRCIQIGLACVKFNRAKRPTTLEILNKLHKSGGAECSNGKEIKAHNVHREQPMPPPQPWGPRPPSPWGHPPNLPPGGPGYGNPQYMPPPPRPQESYYPPPDVPPVEKQPHYGISSYGCDAPPSAPLGNQNQVHGSSQVTHSMQVPLSYADAVIGTAGASASFIRRHSGATLSIQEGAPGEMTVEITGSASQVQTAQQLIKVMISAKDEPDTVLPPAVDGLLRVHKRITDGLDSETDQPQRATVTAGPTRLLVPASQAGSLIGKQGATIKSIQDASKCVLRIVENVPPVALNDDRVVEIQGEPLDAHKAVELTASHLRKFLVDRSVLPLFETQIKAHNVHREQPMPPPQPWGPRPPSPWGHPPNLPPGGPGYGNPQYMPPPPRPQESYYPPPDVPPVEKQPHYGISSYGCDAPPSAPLGNQNQVHGSSQVTHSMQVPLSYADAVIGTAGASASFIRRHSGATLSIQEGAPGEMTVEITGSASQVQTAQQLIKNFMAEASPQGPPAPAPPAQPVDTGYSSYPPPYGGASYGSPPATPGPVPHNGGSYGAAQYPPSYGY